MTDPETQAANARIAAFVERAALIPKAPYLTTDPRPVALYGKVASDPPKAPNPRRIPLPLGGECLMYTRENLTQLYRCSHGELGRLLGRKQAPLPIRIEGQILWFCDEALGMTAQVQRTLERWRKR